MKLLHKKEHPLGTVYLFENSKGQVFEAYFSGDYTQPGDDLRADRYGKIGKIPLEEKAIIKISVMSGCPYRCQPCDAGNSGFFGNASVSDMVSQFALIAEDQNLKTCSKLKLHMSKLGEPALNWPCSFQALQKIIKLYPQYNVIPTVSTLPRNPEHFQSLVHDLFSLSQPVKQLKINLGASNEERRRELLGRCLPLSEIYKIIDKEWKNTVMKQRITFTLLAIDGENIDTNFFLSAIGEQRERFTIELYKVNQTKSVAENGLGNNLVKYKHAQRFQGSMDKLASEGFFTYFSAPSNGEQTALVANGSALLQDWRRSAIKASSS